MKKLIYLSLAIALSGTTLKAEAWYSAPLQAQELIFGNALQWSTIWEANLQQFVVEKSVDGVTFEELGILQASSFSMVDKNYHIMDVNPLSEVTFYRLKEITTNGKFSVSQAIMVERKQRNDLHMLAMSNVKTGDSFSVKLDALKDLKVTCVLKSYKGEILESFTQNMKNGLNEVKFDLKQRPVGLYFVQVINEDEKETFMIERMETTETKLPPVADANLNRLRN